MVVSVWFIVSFFLALSISALLVGKGVTTQAPSSNNNNNNNNTSNNTNKRNPRIKAKRYLLLSTLSNKE
jgi:hypothetical protein